MREVWVLGICLLGSSATSPCFHGPAPVGYRNTGYGRDTTSLLRMVEPRIIINAEEEFLQTGIGTPEPSSREFSEPEPAGDGFQRL
jgi:hypothetical protein